MNRTSKSIERYLTNTGVLEGASIVNEGTGHLSLLLDHGQQCNDGPANYSTRFDFFCNDGEPEKVMNVIIPLILYLIRYNKRQMNLTSF